MLSGPSNLILEIEGKNSLLAFLALGSAMTDGRWLSTRLFRNSSHGIMQSQGSHKKSLHAQRIQRMKNRDQTSVMLLPSTFCVAFISADWPLRCCITTVITSFFEELSAFYMVFEVSSTLFSRHFYTQLISSLFLLGQLLFSKQVLINCPDPWISLVKAPFFEWPTT